MTVKKEPKKNGRPLIEIDWKKVDAMCQIQCTGDEIASVLDIDYSTLERACKREHKVGFAEYIGQKKLGGKASLRRNQWKAAEKGNPTMLIWLGKNYLGQKDSMDESETETAPPLKYTFKVKEPAAEIKVTNAKP
jgi:hypothetical protein